jgi:hypothetical protein
MQDNGLRPTKPGEVGLRITDYGLRITDYGLRILRIFVHELHEYFFEEKTTRTTPGRIKN